MGLTTIAHCDGQKCTNKLDCGEYADGFLMAHNWHIVVHSGLVWYYCPECYEKRRAKE